MTEEIVLIGAGVRPSDVDLFFGPVGASDRVWWLPDELAWPQVLKAVGVCASLSEARRNGWRTAAGDVPVPEGFTDLTVGKRRHRVSVLKILEPMT